MATYTGRLTRMTVNGKDITHLFRNQQVRAQQLKRIHQNQPKDKGEVKHES
nr:hypothetical protein 1 [Pseudomonadaceae bacterium]